MCRILGDLWSVVTGVWGFVFPNRRRYRSINARLDFIERMQSTIYQLLTERTPSPLRIHYLAMSLRESTDQLAAALQSQGIQLPRSAGVSRSMNPLQPLIDEVTRAKGVAASATALINGFSAKIQAAVDAAIAGGATAAQVGEAVGTVLAEFKTANDSLATAVDANDD